MIIFCEQHWSSVFTALERRICRNLFYSSLYIHWCLHVHILRLCESNPVISLFSSPIFTIHEYGVVLRLVVSVCLYWCNFRKPWPTKFILGMRVLQNLHVRFVYQSHRVKFLRTQPHTGAEKYWNLTPPPLPLFCDRRTHYNCSYGKSI